MSREHYSLIANTSSLSEVFLSHCPTLSFLLILILLLDGRIGVVGLVKHT